MMLRSIIFAVLATTLLTFLHAQDEVSQSARSNETFIAFLKAEAESGDPVAMSYLAAYLNKGELVKKDLPESATWLRKASDLGHAPAMYSLSRYYENGIGVPKDLKQSVKWMQQSAELGYSEAQTDLAFRYSLGSGGVKKDPDQAMRWAKLAADQGNAKAQFAVAILYLDPSIGTETDNKEGLKWLKRSALNGYPQSAWRLSIFYFQGVVVPKDELECLAWLYIAAAAGHEKSKPLLPEMEEKVGHQVRLLAQQRSRELQATIDANLAEKEKRDEDNKQDATSPRGSGTGVVAGTGKTVVTAAHVVEGAKRIVVESGPYSSPARILQIDAANDLAVLEIEKPLPPVPLRSSREVKVGETVFTIGFPNVAIQGTNPKMTKGEVSSLTGLGDDPRLWQISAPLQPGNSGGPLFDANGNLIGIVVSTLSAAKMLRITGGLPQNVNYAVKNAYLTPLLEQPSTEVAVPAGADFSNIVERSQQSVVLVRVY